MSWTNENALNLKQNIARIANLPYGQSQLYLKSAFIKRKALIKKMKKN